MHTHLIVFICDDKLINVGPFRVQTNQCLHAKSV